MVNTEDFGSSNRGSIPFASTIKPLQGDGKSKWGNLLRSENYLGRSQMILQKEFCTLYSGEKQYCQNKAFMWMWWNGRHLRLRIWC